MKQTRLSELVIRSRTWWALSVAMMLGFAPLADTLPGWFWPFGAACVAGKMLLPRAALPSALPAIVAFMALGGLWQHFRTLMSPEGFVGILAVGFFGKLLEMRNARDLQWLQLLLLFVAPMGLLFGNDLTTFVMVFGALSATMLSLVNDNSGHDPRPALNTRVSPVLKAMGLAIPVAVVLFLVFPRIAPLWNLPRPGAGMSIGFGDSLDSTSLGRLFGSDKVAFRARFNGREPPFSSLYWRVAVLESFDGLVWRRSPSLPLTLEPTSEGNVKFDLIIDSDLKELVPHLVGARPLTAAVQAMSDGSFMEAPNNDEAVLGFTVPDNTASFSAVLSSADRSRLTNLPGWLGVRSRSLAESIAAQSGGDPGRFLALLSRWWRDQGFRYSLESEPADGLDPVDTFMFRDRTGYCSHFANALAVMLRSVGVPARVISGFQGGTPGAGNGYWVIHQSDAHAWVEAWTPTHGWTALDPTALILPDRIDLGADAVRTRNGMQRLWHDVSISGVARLRDWVEIANYHWMRSVASYGEREQTTLLARWGGAGSLLPNVFMASAVVVVMAGFLAMSTQWYQSGVGRDPTFERVMRHAAKRFRARSPGETVAAYAAAYQPRPGSVALGQFLEAWSVSQYGPSGSSPGSQTATGTAVKLQTLAKCYLASARKARQRDEEFQ